MAGAQLVKLDWVGGEPGQLPSLRDVTVTIATSDQLWTGRFEAPVAGSPTAVIYRIPLLGGVPILQPGGEYTLRIKTPTVEASGTTTVPRYAALPPAVTEVSAAFDRERDTLRLAWPAVPLARRYQVDVYSESKSRGGLSDPYTVFTDTSVTIPGTIRTLDNEPVFRAGANAWVVVNAIDDNYYTYYHPIVDPFAGAPQSRIQGAIGVFGSIVPVARMVYTEVR